MRYTVHIDLHKDYLRVEGGAIYIGLMSKPKRGKANRELIGKLAKHFKVPSSSIRIITGQTSKTKLIAIVEKSYPPEGKS